MALNDAPCNLTFCELLNIYMACRTVRLSGVGFTPSELAKEKEVIQELNDRCPYRPID